MIKKNDLYQILPVSKENGGSSYDDALYCNGFDCISHCIKDLYDKGYKSFVVKFLGEVSFLSDLNNNL